MLSPSGVQVSTRKVNCALVVTVTSSALKVGSPAPRGAVGVRSTLSAFAVPVLWNASPTVNFKQALEPLLDNLISAHIVRPPIHGVDHVSAKDVGSQNER